MEFCPKCKSVILVEGKKAACVKCGYKLKGKVKIEASEKGDKYNKVAVVNERDSDVNPVVKIKCPECKHNEAFFWTLQTRASDESETKFYKCRKCEHTWRVYK